MMSQPSSSDCTASIITWPWKAADRFGVGFGQFLSTVMSAASLLFLVSHNLDVQILGRAGVYSF
jgi:hypothetical protein